MARKSPWEQFANNFTTFYDLGNKIQTDRASKKIMEEEPVVQNTGLGPGPHSVYQASYGGKNYNAEITPEMLRGLQYDRLGDVKARFGDQEGAMSMREKAAGIRNQQASLEATNLSNELAQKTLDFNVKQAEYKTEGMQTENEILEQKLSEMIKNMPLDLAKKELENYGYTIDNSRNLIKFKTEKQTQKLEVELKNLEVDAKKVEIANQKLLGKGYKIDNDGNLVQLGVDRATAKNKITKSRLDVNQQQQQIINDILVGNGLVLDNRGKVVDAETAERTKATGISAKNAENNAKMDKAKAESSAARLENNANLNLIEYSKIIKDGGNFKNKKGKAITGAEWLRENWTGDDATKKVLSNIEDDELNSLMREGTMIIKGVENALTGTRAQAEPAIMELIDGQDSIPNNVQILQSKEGNFLEMIQTDANGENPIVIAKGENWDSFKTDLIASVSPMKALTIAKSNADIAFVQAQTAVINAKLENNNIDVEKVNQQWAGIEEEMRAASESEAKIIAAKNTFIDNYIVSTKGLGAGSSNSGDYIVEQVQ